MNNLSTLHCVGEKYLLYVQAVILSSEGVIQLSDTRSARWPRREVVTCDHGACTMLCMVYAMQSIYAGRLLIYLR